MMRPSIDKLRGQKARFAKDMEDKRVLASIKINNGQAEIPDLMSDMTNQFAMDYMSAIILSGIEDAVKKSVRGEVAKMLIQIGNTINGTLHNNLQQETHKENTQQKDIQQKDTYIIEETQQDIEEKNNNLEKVIIQDKPAKKRGFKLPLDKPYVINRNIRWGQTIDENIAIVFDLLHTLEKSGVDIANQSEIRKITSTVICNSKKLFGMSYGRLVDAFKRKY